MICPKRLVGTWRGYIDGPRERNPFAPSLGGVKVAAHTDLAVDVGAGTPDRPGRTR